MTAAETSTNAAIDATSRAFRTLTIERLLAESLTRIDTRTPRLTLKAGQNEPWTGVALPGFLPDVAEMGLRGAIFPFVEKQPMLPIPANEDRRNVLLSGAEDALLDDEIVTSIYLSPTMLSKLSTIAGRWVRPLLDGSTKITLVQTGNPWNTIDVEHGEATNRPPYRLELLNHDVDNDPTNICMPNASLALVLQWALGDDEKDRLRLVIPILDVAKMDLVFGYYQDKSAPIAIRNFGIRTGGQVIATRHVRTGEVLFNLTTYILLASPTYQSVRLADGFHAVSTYVSAMNHSCDPSADIDVDKRQVTARRQLFPGDEVNFYYPSTEVDIVRPFQCACGASNCVGYITC